EDRRPESDLLVFLVWTGARRDSRARGAARRWTPGVRRRMWCSSSWDPRHPATPGPADRTEHPPDIPGGDPGGFPARYSVGGSTWSGRPHPNWSSEAHVRSASVLLASIESTDALQLSGSDVRSGSHRHWRSWSQAPRPGA